jgi:ABC-type lipoprotein release transport system permease subunit
VTGKPYARLSPPSKDRWPPSLRVSLEALVYVIAPIDPVTFIAAPSRLVIAALAACIAPAVRALRVDPAVTLRQE